MQTSFGPALPLAPRARSDAVDFFRGLALIVIAWDHLTWGEMQRFTLHNMAWCDAAEVFVLLGGYASASAFAVLLTRQGFHAARGRFILRACEIYRAYLVLAMLLVGLGLILGLLGWSTHAVDDDVRALMAHPWPTVMEVLVGRRQPYIAAILAMYAVFALFVPLWLWLRERSLLLLFAISAVVWCASSWLGSFLPSTDGKGWAFNPFAWQLLFVLGLCAQAWPAWWEALSAPSSRLGTRVLLWTGLILVLGFALDRWLWHTGDLPGVLKQNLAWPRLLNVLGWTALAFGLLQSRAVTHVVAQCSWIARLGRHSLSSFMVGACTSMVLNTLLMHKTLPGETMTSIPTVSRWAADLAVVIVLLGWSTWQDQRLVRKSSQKSMVRSTA